MASIITKPLHLTAAVKFLRPSLLPFSSSSGSVNSEATRCSELIRVSSLVEGCDYKHWLVLMNAPKGYPSRADIVRGFVKTLAMALGSEEEAKKSIYSVSTKYYYAFGCRLHEPLTVKIRSLPEVRWILPDSFIVDGESSGGYGGEPFVDGEVVPYDEKYHADWLRDQTNEDTEPEYSQRSRRGKGRRRRS